jgi:hypothetical protein
MIPVIKTTQFCPNLNEEKMKMLKVSIKKTRKKTATTQKYDRLTMKYIIPRE